MPGLYSHSYLFYFLLGLISSTAIILFNNSILCSFIFTCCSISFKRLSDSICLLLSSISKNSYIYILSFPCSLPLYFTSCISIIVLAGFPISPLNSNSNFCQQSSSIILPAFIPSIAPFIPPM